MEKKRLRLNLQMFAEPTEPVVPVEPPTEPNEPKEEMFTKEQMEEIISKRVAREKKAAENALEEAKKLANMNAKEKADYERQQLEQELADYKKKDQFYSMSKEASKMLSEHDIHADDELLSYVVKDDAEATKLAVDSFVSLLNAKVADGVKKALTGKTPKGNTGSNQAIDKEAISAIKDSAERIRAIQQNPHLYT